MLTPDFQKCGYFIKLPGKFCTMTKQQLKVLFMHGWNAHEAALIDEGHYAIVSSKIMDKEFEELILSRHSRTNYRGR